MKLPGSAETVISSAPSFPGSNRSPASFWRGRGLGCKRSPGEIRMTPGPGHGPLVTRPRGSSRPWFRGRDTGGHDAGFDGLVSAATGLMESPLSLLRTHRDHEPLKVWSAGFSRSELFLPPEGGTPNQRRFMESPHGSSPPIGDMNFGGSITNNV